MRCKEVCCTGRSSTKELKALSIVVANLVLVMPMNLYLYKMWEQHYLKMAYFRNRNSVLDVYYFII